MSNSLVIRALAASDASQFQLLRLAALKDSPTAFSSSYEEEHIRSLDAFAQRITPSELGCVFGAFIEDKLFGVVGVRREEGRKLVHKAFIWGMYVKPEHRQRGIGAQLVEAGLAFARDTLHVRQVTLGVNAANMPAIALYQRYGFISFGKEPAAIQVDSMLHDELLMAKIL